MRVRIEREQKQPSLLAHFWEDDTPFPSPADSRASLLWGIPGKNPSAPFGNCILSALWNWSIGPKTAAAPCSSHPGSHICATHSSSTFFVALDDLSSGLSSFPSDHFFCQVFSKRLIISLRFIFYLGNLVSALASMAIKTQKLETRVYAYMCSFKNGTTFYRVLQLIFLNGLFSPCCRIFSEDINMQISVIYLLYCWSCKVVYSF